jgi:hypothetical protein
MYPSPLIMFNCCCATVGANMLQHVSRILASPRPIAAMVASQRGAVALGATRVLLPTAAGGTPFTMPPPSWRMLTGGLRPFSALKKESVTQETLASFSVADVKAWVAGIPDIRDEHVQKCVDEEVDGEQLLKMTEERLRTYGIPGGPAGKILDAIERVKSSGTLPSVATCVLFA